MEMQGLTLHARFAGEDFGIDSASSPRTVCLRFFFNTSGAANARSNENKGYQSIQNKNKQQFLSVPFALETVNLRALLFQCKM